MYFDVFLNFDGDCRDALDFYAKAFRQEASPPMTYGEAPGFDIPEEHKNRIIYADLPIFGIHLMMADCSPGAHFVRGNNISLSLGTSDADELRRLFEALSDGGEVDMPLGKTFFNELFGMVTDQFGITWQFGLAPAV